MASKPTLKLNFNKSGGEKAPEQPASDGKPKFTLKFNQKAGDSDATPAKETTPKPTKKKAPPKGSSTKAKTGPSKKKTTKRDAAAASSVTASEQPGEAQPPRKRIKFSTKEKSAPQIKFNIKGKPRVRPKGYGYDSEASDTEVDPALEEEFLLRMQPGEDCDYLRQAIEEKRFGPRIQGGADVSFKPLTRDGRRATVTIRGHIYAASLVDLPCIVEGMKSWDKRGWYKGADICQMLLVLGRVESEDDALNYPLPKDVDASTFQYAHGLTPPMRRVRKRRFRNRISNRTIEAVELEVARLLRQDENAVKPPDFEIMDCADYAREQRGEEEAEYEVYDEEQDAEGEVDEQYYEGEPATQEAEDDVFEDELAAEMEAALAAHAEASTVPVSAGAEGGQTVPEPEAEAEAQVKAEAEVVEEVEGEADPDLLEAGTPHTKHTTGGETSGDEDESEESSPEDGGAELDEDALAQQQQLQERREEIAELETLLQTETARWEQMTNPILKSKLGRSVQKLKQELSLKKLSIGEGEE